MKKNLGRFSLVFVMLFHLELCATTYTWSATANKTTAAVNEAIHLKYVCEFSDASALYTIDFNPVRENENYSIKILTESEHVIDGKRVNNYEFIAFVHKPGRVLFDFEMTMKKTTQDSINSTILGRDNAQEVEFTSTVLKQKVLAVDVSENPIALVGQFTLEIKKEAPFIKAYEPYHMEIIIEGKGDFTALKPFEFTIDGVKVFSQKIIQNIQPTVEGESGTWSQKLAFVSANDFSLPKITLKYYDIYEKRAKELSYESTEVKVEKAFVKEELLEFTKDDSAFSYEYLYYLLTFLAGFLAGKIKLKREAVPHAKSEHFFEKIKKSKSLDELAMVLAIEDANKYKKQIEQIENKSITSLGDMKKMLNLVVT